MSAKNSYPVQSRLQTKDEKGIAESLASRNGVSVSALIRLLLLQAHREGWSLEIQRKKKTRVDG